MGTSLTAHRDSSMTDMPICLRDTSVFTARIAHCQLAPMTRRPSLEPSRIDDALPALGELLGAAGTPFEIVVIGGAALQVLGLVARPTADVDVAAILDQGLRSADPLPAPLAAAAHRVAVDFGLPDDWLDPGSTAMLQWGLPDGCVSRLTAQLRGAHRLLRLAFRPDPLQAARLRQSRRRTPRS